MNRVEKIIDHLVGSRLPLDSVLTKTEKQDEAFLDLILSELSIDPLTNKWKRYEPT